MKGHCNAVDFWQRKSYELLHFRDIVQKLIHASWSLRRESRHEPGGRKSPVPLSRLAHLSAACLADRRQGHSRDPEWQGERAIARRSEGAHCARDVEEGRCA